MSASTRPRVGVLLLHPENDPDPTPVRFVEEPIMLTELYADAPHVVAALGDTDARLEHGDDGALRIVAARGEASFGARAIAPGTAAPLWSGRHFVIGSARFCAMREADDDTLHGALHWLAMHDGLTGLLRGELLADDRDHAWARHTDTTYATLVLEARDEPTAMLQLAQALSEVLRRDPHGRCAAYRVGVSRIAVVVPKASPPVVERVAGTIRARVGLDPRIAWLGPEDRSIQDVLGRVARS